MLQLINCSSEDEFWEFNIELPELRYINMSIYFKSGSNDEEK